MTTQTNALPVQLPYWDVLRPRIADLAQTALRFALAVPFFKS